MSTAEEPNRHRGAPHANHFDCLRFLLAAAVVYSHSEPLAHGVPTSGSLSIHAAFQNWVGWIAVNGFFVISGFLITQSYVKCRSLADYLRKRIGRIYPGFAVAFIVSAYVVPLYALPHAAAYPVFSIRESLHRLFWLDGTWVGKEFAANPYPLAVNGSLWTIPYEFWCYLGLALLGLTGLLSGRRLLVVFALVMVGSICILRKQPVHLPPGRVWGLIGDPITWARFAPLFLAGMILQRFRDTIPVRKSWGMIAVAVVLAAFLFPRLELFTFAIADAYAIYWLAFDRSLRLPAMAAWGDCSYGLYLYAFPIQQTIVHWYGATIAPMTLFALAIGPSIVAGYVSWYGVERWFLRRGRIRAVEQSIPLTHS